MQKITHCPTINKTKDRSKINKRRHWSCSKPINKLQGWSCDVCSSQANCKVLCPPMEWIAQQVEVDPGREWIPENPDYERESNKWPESLTTSEIIFTMFFFDQLTQVQIADKLYITQQYVSKVINNQKQILIKNLRK